MIAGDCTPSCLLLCYVVLYSVDGVCSDDDIIENIATLLAPANGWSVRWRWWFS